MLYHDHDQWQILVFNEHGFTSRVFFKDYEVAEEVVVKESSQAECESEVECDNEEECDSPMEEEEDEMTDLVSIIISAS